MLTNYSLYCIQICIVTLSRKPSSFAWKSWQGLNDEKVTIQRTKIFVNREALVAPGLGTLPLCECAHVYTFMCVSAGTHMPQNTCGGLSISSGVSLIFSLAWMWGPFPVFSTLYSRVAGQRALGNAFVSDTHLVLGRSVAAADAHATQAGFYLASWDLDPVQQQQVLLPSPLGNSLVIVVCWLPEDLAEQTA